uniref:Calmodulin n=1 Tax=Mucochytrium quahogii TaxID=96639 RepID=A0A7S2S1Z4_9STRA|mmetsp:Transcript_29073/g.46859  ORF Transcript_29073/g.46859 Transcript_29073/m.46859 type:complete len:1944 (-) Transcript_29073:6-5837(-)
MAQAELVVDLRSFKWTDSNLSEKSMYIKLSVLSYAERTNNFSLEEDVVALDKACRFPVRKDELGEDCLMNLRLKNSGGGPLFRGKKEICGVNIQLKAVADVGSPENYATYPLINTDRQLVGEVEMSIFWCYPEDIESMASPKARRFNLKRSLQRANTSQGAIGLDDVKKDSTWVDNVNGVADWTNYSKLTVRVIEAQGLREADSNGFSDPYCAVSCRGTKFKTATIKKTLSPLWDETFHFSSMDGIDAEDEVSVIIRDHDTLSRNDDLGEVVLPLWALVKSGHTQPTWFELSPTKRMTWNSKHDRSLGWVKLSVMFRPRSMSIPTLSRLVGNPASSFKQEDDLGCEEGGVSATKKAKRPMLYIRVLQGRNLPAADANGYSDPYCRVRCRGKTQKTRTVKRTLNPKWNQVMQFGKGDFLQESNEVEFTVFDRDFGVLEGVSDDKLGSVRIPIYLLTSQDLGEEMGGTRWFPLDGGGEIQLSVFFSKPKNDTAVDIYKGKVWLYELQVTVLSGRNLPARNEKAQSSNPFCELHCGAHKPVKTKIQKKTTNPIWNQQFKFRKSADVGKAGLGRMDSLTLKVFDEDSLGSGSALGKLELELGYLLDRIGYVDKGGAELVDYFPLKECLDLGHREDGADSEKSEVSSSGRLFRKLKSRPKHRKAKSMPNQGDSGGEEEDTEPGKTGVATFSEARGKARDKFASFNARDKMDKLKRATANPASSMYAMAPVLPTTSQTTLVNALAKVEPLGAMRLKVRFVPIAEMRMQTCQRLVVQLNKLYGVLPSDPGRETKSSISLCDPRVPGSLYAKVKLGREKRESFQVPFHNHSSGIATFNATLEINDYVSALKSDQKQNRTGTPEETTLDIFIHNASNDSVVAKTSIPLSNLESSTLTNWRDVSPVLFPNSVPLIEFRTEVVTVKEEIKPMIGYFHLGLLKFKVKRDDFSRSYRAVIRYGEKVVATRGYSGDLSIEFDPSVHCYRFEVYEMFPTVSIEIWSASTSASSNDDEGSRGSKWGKLYASTTISTFDLLELEAQTIYNDKSLLTMPRLPMIRLTLSKNGSDRGTLWVEAMFEERMSEVFKPNPNPAHRPPKSFSLPQLRHELNRTTAILGWFKGVGGGLGYLLSWENQAHSAFALVFMIVLCTTDVYSERILALPFYFLFFHVMSKHYQRMNGRFVHQFMGSSDMKETRATIRVSVLKARGLLENATCISSSTSTPPVLGADEVEETKDAEKPHSDSPKRSSLLNKILNRKGSLAKERVASLETSILQNKVGNKIPAARARINIQTELGRKRETTIGYSMTSLPTTSPEFTSTKQGYKIGRNSSSTFHTKIFEWECTDTGASSALVPAFEFNLNLTPTNTCLVLVKLYRAVDLIAADASGTSDPYVVIYTKSKADIKGNHTRSKTINKSLFPEWNEQFVIGGKVPIQASDTLHIDFRDSDGVTATADDLGSVIISMEDVKGLSSAAKWFTLQPPGGSRWGAGECGSVFLSVHYVDFSTPKLGKQLLDFSQKSIHELLEASESKLTHSYDGESREEEESKVGASAPERENVFIAAADSWFRCSTALIVDIENTHSASNTLPLLGSARIPLVALIQNENNLKQPLFEKWLPLTTKMDGMVYDQQLSERVTQDKQKLGEVLVRVEVLLPDPKVKERLMEIEEAKRAEKAGPIAKIRMINQKMENVQHALYNFNNKMEHLKNLFNWSHPRKTQIVFYILLFLCVLFTVIPSRYMLMALAIYLFTDKFRPLGTMVIKFNHVLALVPTDDDLREACISDITQAKRKPVLVQKEEIKSLEASRLIPVDSTTNLTDKSFQNSTVHVQSSAVVQVDLTAEDIDGGESGHLRMLIPVSATFSKSRKSFKWASMYFHLLEKNNTLVWWDTLENFERRRPPSGLFTGIVAIETMLAKDQLHGCERPELAFALINRDNSSLLLVANSTKKVNTWISAIRNT